MILLSKLFMEKISVVRDHSFISILTLPDYTTSKDCEPVSHSVVPLAGTTTGTGTEGGQIIFLLNSHMYNHPMQWLV